MTICELFRSGWDGSMMTKTFSILTATLNAGEGLKQTLESLRAQTCKDFEWVVADGGSKDHTVQMLREEKAVKVRWVSEPDQGISDAFNKCIQMATGQWVLFLGAGDRLASEDVLANALEFCRTEQTRFFYGDVVYDYGDKRRLVHKNYSWSRFKTYSCIPHQAMFLDRRVFAEYGLFDLTYRTCMDYEHTARFIRKISPDYFERVVAVMPRTGVSANPIRTHREMNRVRIQHDLASRFTILLNWIPILVRWLYIRATGKGW